MNLIDKNKCVYLTPYDFYNGLANGGEYELYGCSKDEFIDILKGKSIDEKDEEFEYAAVLEDKYRIDYAVDYLIAVDGIYHYHEVPDGTADFIVEMFFKAVSSGNNAEALLAMGYLLMTNDLGGIFDSDFSFEMYARLADMWKKGLITDDWITGYGGLADVIDWEWGELYWEEDYPECPKEDRQRRWLLKLLESDFANDIADYLKPILEMVLEKEKSHNWENGKTAIESFLAKTAK